MQDSWSAERGLLIQLSFTVAHTYKILIITTTGILQHKINWLWKEAPYRENLHITYIALDTLGPHENTKLFPNTV